MAKKVLFSRFKKYASQTQEKLYQPSVPVRDGQGTGRVSPAIFASVPLVPRDNHAGQSSETLLIPGTTQELCDHHI